MAIVRTSRIDLHGTTAYVAQPDDNQSHPGIVQVQEWWGIEPHMVRLTQGLALNGFVVATPDLYHGKVATDPSDAAKLATETRQDTDRAVREIIEALDTLKGYANVAPKKLGLIGFCLGGFFAITAASHYTDLGAVVPFYGGGYDPTPQDVAKVQASVLAVYGSQDSSIPAEQRQKIERLYKEAGKDYTAKVYDAGHAFVNPDHGMGNATAAKDAWPLAVTFLQEHLRA